MSQDEAWAARRTSFGSAAEAYAYGRPSYPLDALRWILPRNAHRVLDLAAGTGKLTQPLLELGLDVVAVEPLDEMRALIPTQARAVKGTAEAIPLPDGSVDAIVVGQAFHWFDPPQALAEMTRVLRPNGAIGLLWNLDDDRVEWVAELCRITNSEARFSRIDPQQPPPYAEQPGLATAERRYFDHVEPYDADRLVAMIASRSVTILMPPADRDRMLAQVRQLAPAPRFDLPQVCEVWRGQAVGN